MRKPPLGPTTPHRVIPCVLLVGVEPALESTCRQCAALAAGARLEVSDVTSANTRAAELRPFAIVVPSTILEFDPREFDALAQTVGAELVSLDQDEARSPRYRSELVSALRAAFQRRKQG